MSAAHSRQDIIAPIEGARRHVVDALSMIVLEAEGADMGGVQAQIRALHYALSELECAQANAEPIWRPSEAAPTAQ